MVRIYKYQLEVQDEQLLHIEENARILSVQVQNDIPCLWALVDTSAPVRTRTIYTFRTGQPFSMGIWTNHFIGTYQLKDGTLVFHVFEHSTYNEISE